MRAGSATGLLAAALGALAALAGWSRVSRIPPTETGRSGSASWIFMAAVVGTGRTERRLLGDDARLTPCTTATAVTL